MIPGTSFSQAYLGESEGPFEILTQIFGEKIGKRIKIRVGKQQPFSNLFPPYSSENSCILMYKQVIRYTVNPRH